MNERFIKRLKEKQKKDRNLKNGNKKLKSETKQVGIKIGNQNLR